ncbi:MAG TPA: signal peptidase II [Candidatus Eisenbacteria bacterium]|jgi:signal peptidase II|nr:signal peptidase II [Candidatus Eisenbacteria bacterium]
MKGRTGVFLLCAAAVVALDQVTKLFASAHLMPGESISVLGDFIRLTLVHNTGAAFGLFPGSRVPFIVVSVVAIAVVLYLFFRETYRSVANRILLGCILGGAIGNLVDRVRLGYVVDFIDVGFGMARWPVFNAADSAVTIGVLLLAWNLARSGRVAAPEPEDPSRAGVPGG